MTIDEYLAHQSEEEKADPKQIPIILDSEIDVWFRVHWRLSEKLFLFWYIWLKDNTVMAEEFVGEMKAARIEKGVSKLIAQKDINLSSRQ